jgi:chaperonin GroES
MKIKPLGDRVVIEPMQEEHKTKSGIVLPDTAEKERPEKGKILSVGSGKLMKDGTRAKLEVKKGDTVLFSKYGPTEVKMDGKEILIAQESDILAIIE